MMHTACYRGYYCTYEIREDGIYIVSMIVQSKRYPDLFGRKGKPEGFFYKRWKDEKRPEFRGLPYEGPWLTGRYSRME